MNKDLSKLVGRIAKLSEGEKLESDLLCWNIEYYEGDEVGYSTNTISVHFGKDGHIFLTSENGESSIYLYPSQVKKLRGLLRNIPQPPVPKFIPRKAKK